MCLSYILLPTAKSQTNASSLFFASSKTFLLSSPLSSSDFFDLLARKRPQMLNEAKLPILSNSDCQQAYGSYISKKMVCAGYLEGAQRADTCKGDSGGPLICQRDGKWKLFGVTSWGDNTFCNPSPTDSVPGVYTRVDRYRNWIRSRIEMTTCPSPKSWSIFRKFIIKNLVLKLPIIQTSSSSIQNWICYHKFRVIKHCSVNLFI